MGGGGVKLGEAYQSASIRELVIGRQAASAKLSGQKGNTPDRPLRSRSVC